MAGLVRNPHSVLATLRMTGRQKTDMTVHHGGTQEASIAVTVSRSVIYLHTQATAERFASIWREARLDAMRLPVKVPFQASAPTTDVAQPSVVVHTAGRPASIVRYSEYGGGQTGYLQVQIGNVAFLMFDQRSFASCAEVFQAADAAARDQLPRVDLRNGRTFRATPTLGGEQAEQAQLELPARPSILEVAQHLRPVVDELTRLLGRFSPGPVPVGPLHPGEVAVAGVQPVLGAVDGMAAAPSQPAAHPAAAQFGPAPAPAPAHPAVRAAATFASPAARRPGHPTRRQPLRQAGVGRLRLGLYPPPQRGTQNIRRSSRHEGGQSR